MMILGLMILVHPQVAAEERGESAWVPVTVTKVTRQAVRVVEESIGWILSEQEPQVMAEGNGQVVRILVREGESVGAGQLLVELDATEQRLAVQAAQSDVARMEANTANQGRQVERSRILFQKKTLAEDKLDDAESRLVALQEELGAAKARLAEAQRRLTKTRLVAPMAGTVIARLVAEGDFVQPGKPLVQLTDPQKLQIRLPFPESAAVRLRIGQSVTLSPLALPGQAPITMAIDAIRPNVGSGSRSVDVFIHLTNPGNWRPGGGVRGEVMVAVRPNALTVPKIALILRPIGEVVYRLHDKQAMQVPVTTGIISASQVEILGGVEEGDVVIADGAGFLTDGTQVRIKGERQP